MQTRRDQVQAHAFVSGRLVSAMLNTEPDAPFSPQRRLVLGIIIGVVVSVVVTAVFGVIGIFAPGGDRSWRKPGVLIVEKETAARYLYLDGQLRPVLNYTSARLLVEGEPGVVRVARASLRSAPRGQAVGIPSAPDSLPDLTRVDGGDWEVCSSLRRDATGAARAWVTLWVGGPRPGRPLAEPEALAVVAPGGQRYLLWQGRRLLMPSPAVVSALGYAAARQHPVGWAFVNSVPAGPDLVAPAVPDRGRAGPLVDGRATVVGQIFKVENVLSDATEYYVIHTDGLAPLSITGAALMLADPNTASAYPGSKVSALTLGTAALVDAPRSQQVSINDQHPINPPPLADVRSVEVPCVRLAMNADTGTAAVIGLRAVPPATSAVDPASLAGDRLLADRVVVAPGAGLLMRDQPAPGVADGTLYLLVDTGVRFPLAEDKVAEFLGYRNVRPVAVPAVLLALLPVGPVLDPVAARATEPLPVADGGRGPPGQGYG